MREKWSNFLPTNAESIGDNFLPTLNVKSESTFSLHKRVMNTERTTTRTGLVDTQLVLTQDSRLKVVRFDDMDFN